MSRGRCKECGREKPSLAVEQKDDFCSTACARRHHGAGLGERAPREVLTQSFVRPLVTSGSSGEQRN